MQWGYKLDEMPSKTMQREYDGAWMDEEGGNIGEHTRIA